MIEKLKRVPFILIFVIYLGYTGVQFYEFSSSPDGQVEQHQVKMKQVREELDGFRKKLVEGQKFMKSLELRKTELRERVAKLSEYQGMLSEGLDVPSLIKMLLTETKKIQLKVDKIEPGRRIPKEFYVEQEFKLNVRGSFSQMVLFAQRVSQLQRILKIESFSFKPSVATGSRSSNQLDALLSVRAYQYTPSKEDTMAGSYK